MTTSELARFLKVETSRLRLMATKGIRLEVPAARDMLDVIDALDAAVRLIKRAHDDLEDADFTPGDGSCLDDLRLVVGARGEKEIV